MRTLLPRPFLRLWAADTLSSAGDGLTLIAAPLLLTTLTDSPILIAAGGFAAQLPWLLFGLHSGSIVDRNDQRLLIMRVDVVRALLMVGLAVAVLTDTAGVALVYVLLFLSGSGDTLVSTAGTSLVPKLVDRSMLTRANARVIATRLAGGTLLARPIGAVLFEHGRSTPFFVDAISFLIGVALVAGLPGDATDAPVTPTVRGRVREGLEILWRDTVLRLLALCIFVMNVTLSATLAVLVIYSRVRLDTSPTGFGLLGASMAVGGLIGTVLVSRLQTRFGTSLLLKVGLLIELGTQLTLAMTSTWAVAALALLIFGIHGSVWSVLTVTLRQRRTSVTVRGRVMAAYMVLSVGGSALGALLGGVLVETGSITTPMWFGATVVAAVFVVVVMQLRSAEVDEVDAGGAGDA